MMDKKVINLVPGKGKTETNALKERVLHLTEQIEDYKELQRITAKITKERYDALVKEGFTEVQALELCKGIN